MSPSSPGPAAQRGGSRGWSRRHLHVCSVCSSPGGSFLRPASSQNRSWKVKEAGGKGERGQPGRGCPEPGWEQLPREDMQEPPATVQNELLGMLGVGMEVVGVPGPPALLQSPAASSPTLWLSHSTHHLPTPKSPPQPALHPCHRATRCHPTVVTQGSQPHRHGAERRGMLLSKAAWGLVQVSFLFYPVLRGFWQVSSAAMPARAAACQLPACHWLPSGLSYPGWSHSSVKCIFSPLSSPFPFPAPPFQEPPLI